MNANVNHGADKAWKNLALRGKRQRFRQGLLFKPVGLWYTGFDREERRKSDLSAKNRVGGLLRRLVCTLMTAAVLAAPAAAAQTGAQAGEQTELPVLMYHHLQEDPGNSSMVVSPERFAEQMQALAQAGYTAVTPEQLVAYVDHGKPLPEKPVWITFDDGYQSNLDAAAPILERNGLCATIYTIGVSVGKSSYKDLGVPITPHFSFAAARPWVKKGVLCVQSHTYDMHQVSGLDAGPSYRRGVLPRSGEQLEDYMEAFRSDFDRSKRELEQGLDCKVLAFAYPYGLHNAVTEGLLREMGVRVTVTIREGRNTLQVGDPSCLYGMSRFNITEDVSGAQLLARMGDAAPEQPAAPADSPRA